MSRVLKRPAATMLPMQLPLRRAAAVIAAPQIGRGRGPSAVAAEPSAALETERVKAELTELREQAARAGRAEGLAQADQEMRAEREALRAEVDEWRRARARIERAVLDKLEALEPMAISVAFEALAVLLGDAYARGQGVEQTVRRLLESNAGAMRLVVYVPPQDLERVRSCMPDLQEHGSDRLRVEADVALRHACRVVSESGAMEAGLAFQLAAIMDALLKGNDARSSNVEAGG